MRNSTSNEQRRRDGAHARHVGLLPSFIMALCIFAVWKVGALYIDAELILPSPEKAAQSVVDLLKSGRFVGAVGSTLMRVFWSFLSAFVAGIGIGMWAGYSRVVRAAARPLLSVLRTTPVMAVILLALIWFRTQTVPIFVAFLMSFPIVCTTVIEGVGEIDRRLFEMAEVFDVSRSRRIIHISFPAMVPYLLAAAHSTLGLAWKVVIAAEVLSLPDLGIGSEMQTAQLTLETADVLAWTITAVLLSGFSEWVLRLVAARIPWRRG